MNQGGLTNGAIVSQSNNASRSNNRNPSPIAGVPSPLQYQMSQNPPTAAPPGTTTVPYGAYGNYPGNPAPGGFTPAAIAPTAQPIAGVPERRPTDPFINNHSAPPSNAITMTAVNNDPTTNINMGSKLFVGQVPAVCTEDQLRPIFSEYGNLLEVKIMREHNGRSKGSAWVRYETEEMAQRAIDALNEKRVIPPQTNALRVQFATPNAAKANRTLPPQQQLFMAPGGYPQPQPYAPLYNPANGNYGGRGVGYNGAYSEVPSMQYAPTRPGAQPAQLAMQQPGKFAYVPGAPYPPQSSQTPEVNNVMYAPAAPGGVMTRQLGQFTATYGPQ